MIKLNPFLDSAYCKFIFIGKWNVQNLFHIPLHECCLEKWNVQNLFHVPLHECCLEHSHNCTITGGKVKLTMLLRDPGFVTTLQAHGGKATEHVMRAEATKLGLEAMLPRPMFFGEPTQVCGAWTMIYGLQNGGLCLLTSCTLIARLLCSILFCSRRPTD
jgi:hypothetical protein